GGNPRSGEFIFYNHEGAQCIRCHAVFEVGGNVGPGLAGIADKLTRTQLLESVVAPGRRIAPGYGIISVTTNDGSKVSGILMEENDTEIKIKSGSDQIKAIRKDDILERQHMPSGMPDMTTLLSKGEVRDLVAFLSQLKNNQN